MGMRKVKKVEYLFREADEDHIAEQHGNKTVENKSMISKLAYVYEYKQDVKGCASRKKLVNSFYFGGLYQGKEGNERFWKNIQNYIPSSGIFGCCFRCNRKFL